MTHKTVKKHTIKALSLLSSLRNERTFKNLKANNYHARCKKLLAKSVKILDSALKKFNKALKKSDSQENQKFLRAMIEATSSVRDYYSNFLRILKLNEQDDEEQIRLRLIDYGHLLVAAIEKYIIADKYAKSFSYGLDTFPFSEIQKMLGSINRSLPNWRPEKFFTGKYFLDIAKLFVQLGNITNGQVTFEDANLTRPQEDYHKLIRSSINSSLAAGYGPARLFNAQYYETLALTDSKYHSFATREYIKASKTKDSGYSIQELQLYLDRICTSLDPAILHKVGLSLKSEGFTVQQEKLHAAAVSRGNIDSIICVAENCEARRQFKKAILLYQRAADNGKFVRLGKKVNSLAQGMSFNDLLELLTFYESRCYEKKSEGLRLSTDIFLCEKFFTFLSKFPTLTPEDASSISIRKGTFCIEIRSDYSEAMKCYYLAEKAGSEKGQAILESLLDDKVDPNSRKYLSSDLLLTIGRGFIESPEFYPLAQRVLNLSLFRGKSEARIALIELSLLRGSYDPYLLFFDLIGAFSEGIVGSEKLLLKVEKEFRELKDSDVLIRLADLCSRPPLLDQPRYFAAFCFYEAARELVGPKIQSELDGYLEDLTNELLRSGDIESISAVAIAYGERQPSSQMNALPENLSRHLLLRAYLAERANDEGAETFAIACRYHTLGFDYYVNALRGYFSAFDRGYKKCSSICSKVEDILHSLVGKIPQSHIRSLYQTGSYLINFFKDRSDGFLYFPRRIYFYPPISFRATCPENDYKQKWLDLSSYFLNNFIDNAQGFPELVAKAASRLALLIIENNVEEESRELQLFTLLSKLFKISLSQADKEPLRAFVQFTKNHDWQEKLVVEIACIAAKFGANQEALELFSIVLEKVKLGSLGSLWKRCYLESSLRRLGVQLAMGQSSLDWQFLFEGILPDLMLAGLYERNRKSAQHKLLPKTMCIPPPRPVDAFGKVEEVVVVLDFKYFHYNAAVSLPQTFELDSFNLSDSKSWFQYNFHLPVRNSEHWPLGTLWPIASQLTLNFVSIAPPHIIHNRIKKLEKALKEGLLFSFRLLLLLHEGYVNRFPNDTYTQFHETKAIGLLERVIAEEAALQNQVTHNALAEIADAYQSGYSTEGGWLPQNFSRILLLKKALANHGNIKACFDVATLYESGTGCAPNISEAMKYFILAEEYATQSNVPGGKEYGDLASERLYLIASGDNLSAVELNSIGVSMLEGSNQSSQIVRAIDLFNTAIARGETIAIYNLVRCYIKLEEMENAMPHLIRAACHHPQEVRLLMDDLIESGKDFPFDALIGIGDSLKNQDMITQAIEFYQMAVLCGEFNVINKLIMTAQEYNKEVNWFEFIIKIRRRISVVDKTSFFRLMNLINQIAVHLDIETLHNLVNISIIKQDVYQLEKSYFCALMLSKVVNEKEASTDFIVNVDDMLTHAGDDELSYILEACRSYDSEFPNLLKVDLRLAFRISQTLANRGRDHGESCFSLAEQYEDGAGVGKDLIEAARYYQISIERGCGEKASRRLETLLARTDFRAEDQAIAAEVLLRNNRSNAEIILSSVLNGLEANQNITKLTRSLKSVIRVLTEQRLEKGISIDALDDSGNRLLHIAAKYKLLKVFARLTLLGASHDLRDASGRKASDYLTHEERTKVRKLLRVVMRTVLEHRESVADIFINGKKLQRGLLQINKNEDHHTLSSLSEMEQFRPLFRIAKLAALGRHHLSGKRWVNDVDYNSDEDIEIVDNQDTGTLSIVIDPESSDVERFTFAKNFHGVVYPSSVNTLFIGGKHPERYVNSILMHELTHFIALEVYSNRFKPYRNNDYESQREFDAIARDLQFRQHSLSPVLRGAFSEHYVQADQVHDELIVRVSELLVAYPNGHKILQDEAPALYNYYLNKFLPAVSAHADHLSQRMWGGWQPKFFQAEEASDSDSRIRNTQTRTQRPYPPSNTPNWSPCWWGSYGGWASAQSNNWYALIYQQQMLQYWQQLHWANATTGASVQQTAFFPYM